MVSKSVKEIKLNSANDHHQDSFVEKLRENFPILKREVNGKTLVYLDNAATLQKPRSVVESLSDFYFQNNSNVHRSVHRLSQEATTAYEGVREKVCEFLGIGLPHEVIFTRGTTHSINLVAHGLSDFFKPGDSILISRMEHHANFVPWQQLAKRKSLELLIQELNSDYRIDLNDFKEQLRKNPKLVAFSGASNVLGTRNSVRELSDLAKDSGALVLFDLAQSLVHLDFEPHDFEAVDFIAFSSHKLGGPTGVGVLWGKTEHLNLMEPLEYGGDMIIEVKDQDSRWNSLPWKFEAGTPNFADVVAFGAALDFLRSINIKSLIHHESEMTRLGLEMLGSVDGLQIIGPQGPENRYPIFSFTLDSIHPHDLGTFLDQEGIAVRAGHHCAQPLHSKFGIPATTRASFSFYNTVAELEYLVEKLGEAKTFFRRLNRPKK